MKYLVNKCGLIGKYVEFTATPRFPHDTRTVIDVLELSEPLWQWRYTNGAIVAAGNDKQTLELWFAWYDSQLSQAQRELRLGMVWDGTTDRFGKRYANIAELDAQAKTYQEELRLLKSRNG